MNKIMSDEEEIELAANKNLGNKTVLKWLIEMSLQQECVTIDDEGELRHFHTGEFLSEK